MDECDGPRATGGRHAADRADAEAELPGRRRARPRDEVQQAIEETRRFTALRQLGKVTFWRRRRRPRGDAHPRMRAPRPGPPRRSRGRVLLGRGGARPGAGARRMSASRSGGRSGPSTRRWRFRSPGWATRCRSPSHKTPARRNVDRPRYWRVPGRGRGPGAGRRRSGHRRPSRTGRDPRVPHDRSQLGRVLPGGVGARHRRGRSVEPRCDRGSRAGRPVRDQHDGGHEKSSSPATSCASTAPPGRLRCSHAHRKEA